MGDDSSSAERDRVKPRGPERSEGHVGFNVGVRQPRPRPDCSGGPRCATSRLWMDTFIDRAGQREFARLGALPAALLVLTRIPGTTASNYPICSPLLRRAPERVSRAARPEPTPSISTRLEQAARRAQAATSNARRTLTSQSTGTRSAQPARPVPAARPPSHNLDQRDPPLGTTSVARYSPRGTT
jgi:hypothetical protein